MMHRTDNGPLGRCAAVEGKRVAAGRCIEGVKAQRGVFVRRVGTAEQTF